MRPTSHNHSGSGHVQEEVGDMASEQALFKAFNVHSVYRSCGQRNIGDCCGEN